MSVAACTELGYSESGKSTIRMDKLMWFFIILEITTIRTVACSTLNVFLSDCKEPGLTNCTVTPSDTCATTCYLVELQMCNTGWS